MEEEWLDAEAAALHLGLPRRLVYAMIKAGQLPALCFSVRIRRQDLDGCVDRAESSPAIWPTSTPTRIDEVEAARSP